MSHTKHSIPAVVETLRAVAYDTTPEAPITWATQMEHIKYAADLLEHLQPAIEAAHAFAATAQAEGKTLTPSMKKLMK